MVSTIKAKLMFSNQVHKIKSNQTTCTISLLRTRTFVNPNFISAEELIEMFKYDFCFPSTLVSVTGNAAVSIYIFFYLYLSW